MVNAQGFLCGFQFFRMTYIFKHTKMSKYVYSLLVFTKSQMPNWIIYNKQEIALLLQLPFVIS